MGRRSPEPPDISQEVRDAAARMRDAVNLHVHAVLAEGAGGRDRPGYVAIRLDDGRSPDGVLYDSRADATAHHRWDTHLCFIRVSRETMGERESIIILQQMRQARSMGVIFTEEEVVTPQLSELLHPFIPNTLGGLDHHDR